jgi:hypothetical protein
MSDIATEPSGLVAEAGGGQADLEAEVGEIAATHIAEFDAFERVPEALGWVQLGRVGRQGLQVQALGRPVGQEVLDHLGTMNGRAIPDHQQLAGDLSQQVLEEAHHVGAAQGVLADLEQGAAGGSHPANEGQMIAGERHVQDGHLPARGIATDHGRQQVAAGFVDPDDRASFRYRLL